MKSAHITNSMFFGSNFTTKKINNIFSDKKRMQRWLDVEVALLDSQVKLGIVPIEAYLELKNNSEIDKFDIKFIKEEIKKTKHSLIPLLKEWEKKVSREAANYIHYGATTQDIEDTAQMLELREVLNVFIVEIQEVIKILEELCIKSKEIVVVGRTHGKNALPMTLGLKMANWLDELKRNYLRILKCRNENIVSQLFGGVGTMASFKGKGIELIKVFSEKLKLKEPYICWHSTRDRIIEILFSITLTSGGISKIANEIIQLSKDEIGEIEEFVSKEQIGSSTMPHKMNPENCEQIITLNKLIKSNFSISLETLVLEHERDYRGIRTEWVTITDISMYFSKILELIKNILKNLIIKEEKIKKNLENSKESICSEAIMFLLAKKIGKRKAHEYLNSLNKTQNKNDIEKILKSDFYELKDEIEKILKPEEYIGESHKLLERILNEVKL